MANREIRYGIKFDVDSRSLNDLRKSLQDIRNLTDQQAVDFGIAKNIDEARTKLGQVRQTLEIVEDAMTSAFNPRLNTVNIETFNNTLKRSGTSLQQVYQDMSKLGPIGEASFRKMANQVLHTNLELKQSNTILDKMATTLGNTIKWNVASGVVNTFTRSIEQAWGYTKALDSSLNNISIVTGKNADEMGRFAEQANTAAKNLGKTTTDYTDAALIYAQQGLSDKEIEARTNITLKTANVTGESAEKVSEQLTAIWNGYKVDASEAEVYVDRLAAVAATTASDLGELAVGMSKVASAAATLGVDEEQLAAQLSTIISVTKQAPETVGTALRTFYARITDIQAGVAEDGATLGKYSGEMAQMGINVLDAQGHLRDMGQVVEEVGSKWKNMSREQQIALAQTMGGQRQYSNLVALFDNFDDYNKALETARKSQGTLQEQQDTYMDRTQAHLNKLKASWEDLYDSMVDMDAINGLIDGASVLVSTFAKLVDMVGGGTNALTLLGAVGARVFSTQIGRGLNEVITKGEVAKSQEQQFNASAEEAERVAGNQEFSPETRQFFANRADLAKKSKYMDAKDFEAAQAGFKEMTDAGVEIARYNQQLKQAEDDFHQRLAEIEEQEESYRTPEQLEEDLKKAKQQKEDAKAALKKAEQLVTKNESKQKAQENHKNQQPAKSAKKQAQLQKKNLETRLNNLTKTKGISDQIKNQLDAIKSEMDQVGDIENGTAQEMEQAAQTAAKTYQELGQKLSLILQEQVKKQKQILQEATQNQAEIEERMNQPTVTPEEYRQAAREQYEEDTGRINAEKESAQGRYEHGRKVVQQTVGNNADRGKAIAKTSEAIGQLAEIAVGIQTIQDFGSIITDENLSGFDKLTQGVGALTTSGVTLFTGFKGLSDTLGEITTATAGATGGFAALGSAAAGLQAALPGIGVAAGIIAIGGAIAQARDNMREAAIQQAQAEIDEQNTRQQEIASNEALYDSISDLNEQYKNGDITRGELKSSVQNLIDQYGLEGEAVKDLTSHYDNLTEAISRQRGANADELVKSTEREKQSAIDQLNEVLKGKTFDNIGVVSPGLFSAEIGGGLFNGKENLTENTIKSFEEAGAIFTPETGTFHFAVSFDEKNPEEIVAFYDKLIELKDKLNRPIDEGGMTSLEKTGPQYKQLVDLMDELESSVTSVRNGLQDNSKAVVNALALDDKSLSKIDDAYTYLQAKNKLIEQSMEKIQDKDKAIEATEAILAEKYGEQFLAFDESAKFIEQAADKYHVTQQQVADLIKSLDEDQLAHFLAMDPTALSSYEALQVLLDRISKKDFSNVKDGLWSFDDARKNAAETYNKYQGIRENVKSGKSISAEDYDSLTPEMQEYFRMMGDGTYRLTQSVKEFEQALSNLQFQGYIDAVHGLNEELTHLSGVSKNFNYNDLLGSASNKVTTYSDEQGKPITDYASQTSYQVEGAGTTSQRDDIDYDKVQNQLDYLELLSRQDSELNDLVTKYQALADTKQLTYEQADAIGEAIRDAGDQTEYLKQQSQTLTEQARELAQQFQDAVMPLDDDVKTEELQHLADKLQETADESKELADSLEGDRIAAEEVAEAILRFSDAIDDVTKNYDDWIDVLKNGGEAEKVAIMEDLADAYGDLLNVSNDSFSESFLENAHNLELMKQAAEGNIDAYNELADLAAQDILIHIENDGNDTLDSLKDEYDTLKGYLEDNEIEIGAEIDDAGVTAACQNIADNAFAMAGNVEDAVKMANAAYSELGYDVELTPVTADTTDEQAVNSVHHERSSPTPITFELPKITSEPVQGTTSRTPVANGTTQATGYLDNFYPVMNEEKGQEEKTATATGLKVTRVGKGATGASKINNSKRKIKNNAKGGGKGGGKKGGGGGGKSNNTKVDKIEKSKPQRDIYRKVNENIKKNNRELQKLAKNQNKVFGKDLVKNIQAQSKALERQNKLLKQKNELQKDDLANQRKELEKKGLKFNSEGFVTQKSYNKVMGAADDAVAAAEKKAQNYRKSHVNKKGELSEKENKKFEEYKKKIDERKKERDQLKSLLDDYDKTMDAYFDTVDEKQELLEKKIENNITKLNLQVKLRLDVSQAKRSWWKFKRQTIDRDSLFRGSDFEKIAKDYGLSQDNAKYYFKQGTNVGTVQPLTTQINTILGEIEIMQKGGKSKIFDRDLQKAFELLKEKREQLQEEVIGFYEYIEEMEQSVLDTIDAISDAYDRQAEKYEYANELLQHSVDLLSILYGDKNYAAMTKYNDQMIVNTNNQIQLLEAQAEMWDKLIKEAEEAGDNKLKQTYEQNWKNTLSKLNGKVEDAAQLLRDRYTNQINRIFDDLDKRVTKGLGTDYINTQWELMRKNENEYLDAINQQYAIQDIERKYNKAIDSTSNLKSQKALKQVMEEQMKILREKDKLTQYDVDRAQKVLKLEQARAAFEDARASKTTLRLKRDAQGNYSYQYVSDTDAIKEAEEELAAAQNQLYNFDKDAYESNLDDMLTAWKDFQAQYSEISSDISLTDEERTKKQKLLQEKWSEYINNKQKENYNIQKNLMSSAFEEYNTLYTKDTQNFIVMSQTQQKEFLTKLVPSLKSGVQQLTDTIAGNGGFVKTCQSAFNELNQAHDEFESSIKTLFELIKKEGKVDGEGTAANAIDNLKNGVSTLATTFQETIDPEKKFIKDMNEKANSVKGLVDQIKSLVQTWLPQLEAANTTIHNANTTENNANKQTANAAAEANQKKTTYTLNKPKLENISTEKKVLNDEQQKIYNSARQAFSGVASMSTKEKEQKSWEKVFQYRQDKNIEQYHKESEKYLKQKNLLEAAYKTIYKVPSVKLSDNYSITITEKSPIQDQLFAKYMKQILGLSTGGYTGEWNDSNGKLALLHQKELVLNQTDTKNLLDSVTILRSITSTLGGDILDKLSNIKSGFSSMYESAESIEQNVHIEASFPNVNSKKEIEEAFSNLVNLAAQRAMRRK